MTARDTQPPASEFSVGFGVRALHRLLFMVTVIVMWAVGVVARLISRHRKRTTPLLCIEAGTRGWELIEYEELLASAREYLGESNVVRVTVTDQRLYLRQVGRALKVSRPSHYFHDPRTGAQTSTRAIWQAMCLSAMLTWYGVTPISWLANFPVRRWRLQCALVTARAGVTVTLMSAQVVGGVFLHRRFFGPAIFPVSERRINALAAVKRDANRSSPPRALFVGSLYEPRTTKLEAIRTGLLARSLDLELKTRQLGSVRTSNDDYWADLASADILVTTADQVHGDGIDSTTVPHLIFRYSEALATGALLIAPAVPGISRYFRPGKHFVEYESVDEAIDAISHYLTHPAEGQLIAAQGFQRMKGLSATRAFWTNVDSALGPRALI